MRRILVSALLLAAAASPAAAQGHDHTQPAAGHGAGHAHAMPAGWTARLDRANANVADMMFMQMGGGYHVVTGPAAILYNPATTATGAYTARGTFRQNKLSAHPEAYGLILGGRNLTADNQDYLYFLVRQDGQFTIKHRAGSETHTLMDWTENAAVAKPDAQGRATNALSVASTPTHIRFLVNGTQVAEFARPSANTDGVVGLRINHNLDVMVTDFAVQPTR
ncbi:MAG TPA: hypothetical protein VF665_10955 [Longimicrobium sp.]|jgi:opacity protein-like surface antigen|uniref:hypothetical protein n=1 Tax=Longimicrobium sp. TaxID=2029185 RepID=UPI002EDBAECD